MIRLAVAERRSSRAVAAAVAELIDDLIGNDDVVDYSAGCVWPLRDDPGAIASVAFAVVA